MEAKGPNGEKPPSSNALRDDLGTHFLGDHFRDYDLMSVADMAISNAGQAVVFERIKTLLDPLTPSAAHCLLPKFRWRALATTNYDLLIERAYAIAKQPLQHVVPIVKNSEPVEERLQSAERPVLLLKLHGCIDHVHDDSIPLILSHEHYALHDRHRDYLFNRLQAWTHESTFIFCGYRLGDAHIRNILHRLASDGVKRPTYYIVAPEMREAEASYWAKQSVEIVRASFLEFMSILNAAIPEMWRSIDPGEGLPEISVRTHFRTNADPSRALISALDRDLTHVRPSMPYARQDAKKFYEGYDTGWGAIVRKLDVQRRIINDLLLAAVLEESSQTAARFFLLRGPAGSGKTVALKRAAWEAATALDQLVLWFEESGALRSDALIELYDLTGKRIFVVIDRAALHAQKIDNLLGTAYQRNIPITILSAERESEWNAYGSRLSERWKPKNDFRINKLSRREIEELIDLLEQHNSLGLLGSATREIRVAAFLERADRQLLVALHEVTRGKPFEEIVYDEYQGISPENARRLYLDICTLNQFGTPVRAGTIARVSGIRFDAFKQFLFDPLENVVLTHLNPYTGDIEYRARHARVALMVFQQACPTDEAKVDQLVRLIAGLDIGYTPDREAIEHISRGRSLTKTLGSEFGREVYRALLDIAPDQAFIYQQWAIFESTTSAGSLEEADRLAKAARDLDPGSRTIAHTQAEVARKRAVVEHSPLLKEQFRLQVRQRLREVGTGPIALSSQCKLLVDEINDLAEMVDDNEDDATTQSLAEKTRQAEIEIRRAQQLYSDNADFHETEARLGIILEQRERAVRALERAWKANPRGAGVAIRLSKAYFAQDDEDKARSMLDDALSRHPDDKGVHFEMAKVLLRAQGDLSSRVGEHLYRSYATGDANFEARHIHAQYLLLQGMAKEALQLFEEVDRKAPPEFRSSMTESAVSKRLGRINGRVVGKDATYLFARSNLYPKDIYANESRSDDRHWREIRVGSEVTLSVFFKRNGPVGIDVRLKYADTILIPRV